MEFCSQPDESVKNSWYHVGRCQYNCDFHEHRVPVGHIRTSSQTSTALEKCCAFLSRVPVIFFFICFYDRQFCNYLLLPVRTVSSGLGADVRHKRWNIRANGTVVGLVVRQSTARKGRHVTGVYHTHDRIQSHRSSTVPEQTDVSARKCYADFSTNDYNYGDRFVNNYFLHYFSFQRI